METLPSKSPLLLLCALAAVLATAPAESRAFGDAEMRRLYAPFQKLLDAHLVEKTLPGGGLVSAFRYDAALASPEIAALLAEQRQALAAFDPGSLRTRDSAVAFWINAYNYFMLQYLLENPRRGEPARSVKDYGHLLSPYRLFSLEEFEVGGRRYSLDAIEKGTLLGDEFAAKGWKDARIHFAVNCASVGCPPLRAKLYLPGSLGSALDDSTRRALLTDRHLRVEGDTLHLSQLFEWYEGDYAEQSGSVREFLAEHAGPELRRKIAAATRIEYIKYDWDLNRPSNFPELR